MIEKKKRLEQIKQVERVEQKVIRGYFSAANLVGADLRGAKEGGSGDLSGANMGRADLGGPNKSE